MTGFLGGPFSFDTIGSYILSLFCIFHCDFRGGIGDWFRCYHCFFSNNTLWVEAEFCTDHVVVCITHAWSNVFWQQSRIYIHSFSTIVQHSTGFRFLRKVFSASGEFSVQSYRLQQAETLLVFVLVSADKEPVSIFLSRDFAPEFMRGCVTYD